MRKLAKIESHEVAKEKSGGDKLFRPLQNMVNQWVNEWIAVVLWWLTVQYILYRQSRMM